VHNWIETTDNSKLRDDMRTGSNEEKELLGSTARHAVALFWYGLQLDDRDNEVSTHNGTFQTVIVRLSPGGSGMFPYRYGEVTFDGRVYIPIEKPQVTLACRLVGDVLFGNPPFYELARFNDSYAIGGTNGVRGVPAGRYYGKMKVLGNVELRTELISFHLLGKPLIFGVTAFLDGGRVWADTSPQPELDGAGVGLKFGTGGGLRLQSESSFVIRADVAWSPDATPVGGYFAVGQMF
jgi:outer membrane protein assembly factor BamA